MDEWITDRLMWSSDSDIMSKVWIFEGNSVYWSDYSVVQNGTQDGAFLNKLFGGFMKAVTYIMTGVFFLCGGYVVLIDFALAFKVLLGFYIAYWLGRFIVEVVIKKNIFGKR